MMRQTTTLPVWSNPADPLTPYRPGNPSNLLWNDDAATTLQTAPTSPASPDCCAHMAVSLVLLVVALIVTCVVLWQLLADRCRK